MAKNYPPLILELTDRKPSSYVMTGTEASENPDRLDVSSVWLLVNDSQIVVPGKSGSAPSRAKTRWITGCEEIRVDKQKEQNVEYDPLRDVIVFVFGRLVVQNREDDPGLYDFLKTYDGNESNPNRPENCPPVFKEINTSIEAQEKIVDIPELAKVTNYFARLMTVEKKAGGGMNIHSYDVEKINWLLKLFRLSTGESDSEKVRALWDKANLDPAYFNDVIEDASGDLKVVIKMAQEYGVINLDSSAASYVDGKEVICKLRGKTMTDKISELAEFLKSSDGEIHNSAIRVQVEHAKDNLLNNKN